MRFALLRCAPRERLIVVAGRKLKTADTKEGLSPFSKSAGLLDSNSKPSNLPDELA